ncbi:DUF1343 domain-containing protein [Nibrella saemangeumensis]|uniref:DUF1343 domain-containing protein n=1 Tax=Nibrella saemangeumensis TaxID=1084526 RepID=A0ABP8MLH6_9BACT
MQVKSLFVLGLALMGCLNCTAQSNKKPGQNQAPAAQSVTNEPLQLGAEQFSAYLPLLQGKRVGMVVNHTSIVRNKNGGYTHLVDTLLAQGVTVKSIFAPEHGFRGKATDGEKISNSRDPRSGVSIISLYGSNYKPAAAQLDSLDIVIFDIQDVGTRFYTYISTMHYAMEACAENNKPILILDRPNPNGHIVDGPVLDPKFRSFVGMHRIPVAHGLTIGELAKMINGEKWLKNGVQPNLTVIPLQGYTHQTPYTLPMKPSPNLPNQKAVLWYPSLCFFEGTVVSVGRGTDKQFQVIGGPDPNFGTYTFTPVDKPGAMNPPQEGKQCYGMDMSQIEPPKDRITLKYLIDFYQKASDKEAFFLKNNGIDRLAGSDQLRYQIKGGLSEANIRKSWEPELGQYKTLRKKYLLYQ